MDLGIHLRSKGAAAPSGFGRAQPWPWRTEHENSRPNHTHCLAEPVASVPALGV